MDDGSGRYAVGWHAGGLRCVGYAQFGPSALRLVGGFAGREHLRAVRYRDVRRVELVRDGSERRLAVHVESGPIVITGLDRAGSLGELAHRLRLLAGAAPA